MVDYKKSYFISKIILKFEWWHCDSSFHHKLFSSGKIFKVKKKRSKSNNCCSGCEGKNLPFPSQQQKRCLPQPSFQGLSVHGDYGMTEELWIIVTRKNSAPGKTSEQELFSYKPESTTQKPRKTDICTNDVNILRPAAPLPLGYCFQITPKRTMVN